MNRISAHTTTSPLPLAAAGSLTCVVAAYVVAHQPAGIVLYLLGAVILLFIGFFHSRIAIYLVIFSMLLSPELGFGSADASRPVTVRLEDLLLLVLGVAWLARTAYYKEMGFLRQSPLNRPIAAYALAAILATVVSGWLGPINWLKALLFLAKYLEYFILYFLVLNNIHSRSDIKKYLAAAIVTSVVVSIIGIGQIPSGRRVSAPFEGEIGEPNTFGGYLVLLISLAGGFYLVRSSLRERLLWLGYGMVLCLSLLYTLSRTSWLAALGAFLVLLVLSPRKFPLFAAGVLALAIYPLLAPQQVMDRVDYTFQQPESTGQIQVGRLRLDTSLSARIESWGYGFEGWTRRPLTGYGVAGFAFLDAQYMLILTETGILGLATFAWLAVSIWRMALECYRAASDEFAKAMSLGFLAGFGAMLVHGLGANTFIIIRIMEPFWLLTALVASLPDHPEVHSMPVHPLSELERGEKHAGA